MKFKDFCALLVALGVTLFLAAGCSSPEKRLERGLATAAEQFEAGETNAALDTLEALQDEFPTSAEVAMRLGQAYTRKGDAFAAGLAYQEAYDRDNSRAEALLAAADAYAQVPDGEPLELESLQTYLEEVAEAAPRVHLRIARILRNQNKVQPAIRAYLEALNRSRTPASPADAVSLGELYLKAGNGGQAEQWLIRAVEGSSSGDLERIPAYLGLLRINASRGDWDSVGLIIGTLEEEFPGALQASPQAAIAARYRQREQALAEARRETAAITGTSPQGGNAVRTASPETEGEPASAPAAEGGTEPVATVERPEAGRETETTQSTAATDPAAEPSQVREAERAPREAGPDPDEASPAPVAEAEPAEAGEPDESTTFVEDKMQAVDNVVSATAAPDTRAPAAAEAAEPASTQESAEGKAEAVAQAEPESTEPTSDPPTAAEPVERLSAEAWFERGENAREAGEPEAAVKAYRQALTQKPGMARAWLGLSRAHLLAGDMERAEFPALEAIRTGGSNVDFTLNYLEILQETGTARELLRELEKAKDRFPTSPAITLALASAYENIARNRRAAAYLYREFMTMAAPGSDYYQQAQEGLRRTGG